jgi:hypothetical protein
VTIVGPDGETGVRKVQTVFVTHNQLVKVDTDEGSLFTTRTQPLCLAAGGFRATEEIKPANRSCAGIMGNDGP